MRNSLILSLTLLGASALAAPHAGHQHKARDTTTTWTKDNDVYIEDVHVVTAVVGQSQPPPTNPTPTSKPGQVEEKIAYRPHLPAAHPAVAIHTAAPAESSHTPETTPAPASSAPSESGSGSATGTGPVPGPSNINTAGSPTWSTSPNSMGKSILGTANYWRHTWNSSLGPFEWDATLAGNARSTAVDPIVQGPTGAENEGGANQMNHMLNPGSMAQCINEGDGTTVNSGLTPFEQAWLGWLCELPNSNIPCDKIGETGNYAIDPKTGRPDTAHADIIQDGYTKMGCYYQDGTDQPKFVGMWTCDFA